MKFKRIAALVLATTLALPTVATAFGSSAPSGVDVSIWQHPGQQPINWEGVRSDGHSFAIIKATEGTTYLNPHFQEDVAAAAAAGLLVGSYHLGRTTSPARLQAAEYAAALAGMPQPSLPPVLDIEYNDGATPQQMQAWIREFVSEIEQLTGRTPVIYTYRYFWENEVGNTTEFNHLPLWMAAYQSSPPTTLPGGWEYMTMWQRTGSGQVTGIPVDADLNLFNGSSEELQEFLAGNPLHLSPVELPGLDELQAFGTANPEIVAAILAVGAGLAGVGALQQAAAGAGLELGPVEHLVSQVQQLIASGNLPVADLSNMLANGTYSIGDLMILLSNAAQQAPAA